MGAEHDTKARRIVEYLSGHGYRFFNIEGCRRFGGGQPRHIGSEKVCGWPELIACKIVICAEQEIMDYAMRPREHGAHPNILASLPRRG